MKLLYVTNKTDLINKMHADVDDVEGFFLESSATIINIVQCLSICDLSVALPSPHAFLNNLELIFFVMKTNTV